MNNAQAHALGSCAAFTRRRQSSSRSETVQSRSIVQEASVHDASIRLTRVKSSTLKEKKGEMIHDT